jgi:glycerophosphoryl diester phosphodiesterase
VALGVRRLSRATAYPFLDAPGPLAFSHRSLGGGLENALRGFSEAVDLGYRYLETDVHATRDGVLVAFHDRTLGRVTDARGRIADLSWAQVRRARIAGREPIPLLDDVLDAFPAARINIDVKHPSAVAPLIDRLRRGGDHLVDRVCVGSFSDRRVAAVRRGVGPRLCTALGPAGVAQLRAVAAGRLPAGLVPTYAGCAQVPLRAGPLRILTRSLLATAHRAGLQVHVWTVNDAAVMRRLLDLGVDGIMTDRPRVLRTVLEERGAWTP